MARQKGPLKVQGTLGDITFYKSQDGYLVREKGGVSGKRIKSDPAFARTRENGTEFGVAAQAGKLLRTAMRTAVVNTADNRIVSRIHQQMMKVLQADTTSARGLRNVTNGKPQLLTDFEFNSNAPLSATFLAPYGVNMNRMTGELSISIPPFIPAEAIAAPAGATHYKITTGGAEVDFENHSYVVQTAQSAVLPLDGMLTTPIGQENSVTAASTNPLFLLLSISFYQQINSEMYLLNNGAFNAAALIKVNVL